VKLAIPRERSLEIALDKSKTQKCAESLGIPVPKSVHILDMPHFHDVEIDLSYPIVLKPVRSIGQKNKKMHQLSVSYALNYAELRSKIASLLQGGEVLLQEFFPGVGVGIELIAEKGKIIYAFQHVRLHEIPLTGGGSCLRKSTPIEPALLIATEKLINKIKWHGVAMVEFKWRDRDQKYCLMEINGRFWGSLPLAVKSGADFPRMLYELLVDGRVSYNTPYRNNVLCRNLGRDIYWHELIFRPDTDPRIKKFPAKLEVVNSIFNIFSMNHRFDIQQFSDPFPGLIDILRIIRGYFNRLMGYINNKLLIKKQIFAWRMGRVNKRLKIARQVLFVCYGNINRSALAEMYWQQVKPETGIKCLSAGFHQDVGRPADPIMVDIAFKNGIDMKNCSSLHVNARLIAESDLIFVMETKQLEQLGIDFPMSIGKTFLLGASSAKDIGNGTISDPYGKAVIEYKKCFKQITLCVDKIKKQIRHI
jgi:predicted ATP-grasp superfamily ATP-dependent carboligase